MHCVVANDLEGPCVCRPVLPDRRTVADNEKFPFSIDAAVQLTAIVLDRLGIVIGSPHTARGGDDLRRMICEERDADAIVPEVLLAPRALDRAMLRMLAPADERLLALSHQECDNRTSGLSMLVYRSIKRTPPLRSNSGFKVAASS